MIGPFLTNALLALAGACVESSLAHYDEAHDLLETVIVSGETLLTDVSLPNYQGWEIKRVNQLMRVVSNELLNIHEDVYGLAQPVPVTIPVVAVISTPMKPKSMAFVREIPILMPVG